MSGKGPATANADGQVTIVYYYGYNLTGLGGEADVKNLLMNEGVPVEELKTAGQKVMFADGMYDRLNQRDSWGYLDENSTGCSTGHYITAYRHSGGANVTFFDGHAAATPRDDLLPVDTKLLTDAGRDPAAVWKLPN